MTMFDHGYVHCNVLQRGHCITTFINGYVTMWHPSTYVSKCNMQHFLCHIAMFIKVDVILWHSIRVYVRVQCTSKFRVKCDTNNGYVELQHLSKIMSQCNVHQSSHWIATSRNGVMLHENDHDYKGFCCIVMFIKHCNIHLGSWHIVT